MKHPILIWLCSVAVCASCADASDAVADHLDTMPGIAAENGSPRDDMETALNRYLDAHEAELRMSIQRISNIPAEKARLIFEASMRLNYTTTHCSETHLVTFNKRLSDIILPTALPTPQ